MRLPMVEITSFEDVTTIVEAFSAEHERLFAVRDDQSAVEFLVWRLQLRAPRPDPGNDPNRAGPAPHAGTATGHPHHPHPSERRTAVFDGRPRETDIFDGATLRPGARISGPAIIEEPTTTVVVPAAASVTVLPSGNYQMEISR